MNDILERYEELYKDMANSGNKDKMIAFGNAERWAFKKMNELSPQMAQCWLDKLEAMHWKNFLSKRDAEVITSKLVNQNGKMGAHWPYDTLKTAVENLGGKMAKRLTTIAMRCGLWRICCIATITTVRWSILLKRICRGSFT